MPSTVKIQKGCAIGDYAGLLGAFCKKFKTSFPNSLIVVVQTGKLDAGFDGFQRDTRKPWGDIVSKCLKDFHVSSATKERAWFSGKDGEVNEFLNKPRNP